MDKAYILEEIKRTARENGGVPLGRVRFADETGIRVRDWSGLHWARWADAVREAGFSANQLNCAFEREGLLEKYADFARELGRLPAKADLQMKRRSDSAFPSHNTFNRLGAKADLVAQLREFCRLHLGYEGVVRWCDGYEPAGLSDESTEPQDVAIGYVYLIKSGRFYKIGRSNSVGRREYELAIQLPEATTSVHVIRTDDPSGIEVYWHKRFESKRMNGEWFDLNASDITAFKRRKFM